MITDLEKIIKTLPRSPGVYFFKNAHNEIIYIGKAKSLRDRVASYLTASKFRTKTTLLQEQAEGISWLVTESELSAMIAEADLIKRNKPKFNIVFKDSSPFHYLHITEGKEVTARNSIQLPQLEVTIKKKSKGVYAGPFMDGGSARRLQKLLQENFRLTLCSRKIINGCLNYHLGKCAGNCKEDFDQTAYLERIDFVRQLLLYGAKKLIDLLQEKIEAHNERYEFERSKELFRYKNVIETKMSINNGGPIQQSTRVKHIWIYEQEPSPFLTLIEENMEALKTKAAHHLMESTIDNANEDLEDALRAYYNDHQPPPTIITNLATFDGTTLAEYLTTQWKPEIPIHFITKPTDHNQRILQLALAHIKKKSLMKQTLSHEIAKFLEQEKPVETIDCFDISHHQGQSIVGSSVRFVNGAPDKSQCRRFIIRSIEGQNDYAALQEVSIRRYKSPADYPDVLMIDGGKGQLHAAQAILHNITLISIAKREERIYSEKLDGKKLNPTSNVGKALIGLRDYAHHFAITFHRERKRRAFKNNEE